MRFAYEDLSDGQFEELVVLICQELFGVGVQGFAKGPDGGRDARFEGTAQLHPSKAAPWKGITIIQAKQTNGYNRSFSESDFETILNEEIPRIQKLRTSEGLDHYILFSNRRLTGNKQTEILARVSQECKLPTASVSVIGLEQLELYMKRFPDVAKYADLDPVDAPLIVGSSELAEVVEALANQLGSVSEKDVPPTKRVSFEKKNQLNKMSDEYAKAAVKRYMKDTFQIKEFLSQPGNQALMSMYEAVVEEFQFKIIAKRKDHQSFDEVMEHIVSLLLRRDAVLRQIKHKRLTRAVLFYMYWNCDIGVTDVEAE